MQMVETWMQMVERGCRWSVAGGSSGNGGRRRAWVAWRQEADTQQKNRSRRHHGLRHRRRPLTSPQTNKPQRQAEQKSRDDREPGLPPRSRRLRRGRRFKHTRGSCARRCGARRAGPVDAIPVAHSLRIRWIGIPSRWYAVLAAHDRSRMLLNWDKAMWGLGAAGGEVGSRSCFGPAASRSTLASSRRTVACRSSACSFSACNCSRPTRTRGLR